MVFVDNNLDNLNKVLYEQLEILNNSSVDDANYKRVKDKAISIANVGNTIIKSTEVQLKAAVFAKTFNAPKGAIVGHIESHE